MIPGGSQGNMRAYMSLIQVLRLKLIFLLAMNQLFLAPLLFQTKKYHKVKESTTSTTSGYALCYFFMPVCFISQDISGKHLKEVR